MLVLSRKPDESVIIDDKIEVIVMEVIGTRVRLGFQAPDSISIKRKEVWLELAGTAACEESNELSDAAAA